MSAFLFIPTTQNAPPARRVDLATLASLFAEAEEPASRSAPFLSEATRLAAIALILVGILGDTVLVARPRLLADVFATRLGVGQSVEHQRV